MQQDAVGASKFLLDHCVIEWNARTTAAEIPGGLDKGQFLTEDLLTWKLSYAIADKCWF